jgi:signal transduction histidine kinase
LASTSAEFTTERTDSAGTAPQPERQRSIRRRVVQLVMVPSVVALLLWFSASGYLVWQGFYNRAVANSVRQVSIPAVSALSSIQQERRLSVAYLARPAAGFTSLLTQRQRTDAQLVTLRSAADGALANAPSSIIQEWTDLTGLLDRLPATRSAVDARSASEQSAYAFYNTVLDAATGLFDTQARVVPDVTASQGGITATEVFRAGDTMSRAGSVIDGAFASRTLTRTDYLEFVTLVGAYHSTLANVAAHLEPGTADRYAALRSGDAWKQLAAAEDALVASGPWRAGKVPAGLGVTVDRWARLTAVVSAGLTDLTVSQADEVSAKALHTGDRQLWTASLGSLAALFIAVAAIVWAVRQSRILVDRALSVRLAKLGADADTLVAERMPAVMDRLRRRESVDLDTEFAAPTYGDDEIGQVARVINQALRAAAGAAVDEARARAAGTAMLMGVARRPQRPLQRGLKVVEDLQSRIGDEALLTELFDVHHQLNQTRRFLENLVILAGGQIGRRFQNPVPLRRVLLASFAEARNYQRITLRSAADVSLLGHAVAEVIHLLAELLDNALAFSPPETTVWVTSSPVNHGVAIEIEDAGVGMNAEVVERANTLLATAPTPDVTELREGAQIGLYVVSELAKREGVQVSLRRSAYGGLLAIVLLPQSILIAGPLGIDGETTDAGPRRVSAVPAAPRRAEPDRPVPAEAAPAPRSAVGVLEPEPELSDRTAMSQPTIAQPTIARPTATSADSSGPQSAARPPLPHRRPQQHLAPELLDSELPEASAPATPRSPETARNRFARYQQGRADGRRAGRDDSTTTPDQGRNA